MRCCAREGRLRGPTVLLLSETKLHFLCSGLAGLFQRSVLVVFWLARDDGYQQVDVVPIDFCGIRGELRLDTSRPHRGIVALHRHSVAVRHFDEQVHLRVVDRRG